MSVMTTRPGQSFSGYHEPETTKSWTRWQDWANLLLGLLLWICPAIFSGVAGGSDASASMTTIIAGTVIAGIAVWALSEPDTRELQGIIAVAGGWLILTPMMFGFVSSDLIQTLLHWAAGAIALVLALWAIMDQSERATTRE